MGKVSRPSIIPLKVKRILKRTRKVRTMMLEDGGATRNMMQPKGRNCVLASIRPNGPNV